MTFKWFTSAIICALTLVGGITASPSVSQAEIIDLDVSGVAPEFRSVFRRAEAFWDARLLGYSNTIPGVIRNQHSGRLFISASTAVVDGAGGILGFAGPNEVLTARSGNGGFGSRNWAVAQSSSMFFDVADLGSFTEDELFSVVQHEMAHAFGFGTLWEQNDLLQFIPNRGVDQFRGIFARRAFAVETDRAFLNQTAFVPIDQPSRGHWDPNNFFFNQIARNGTYEALNPFFFPGFDPFISETSWASLADLGYVVAGINDGSLGSTFGNNPNPFNGFPKTTGGAGLGGSGNPTGAIPGASLNGFQNLTTAVPEPSSLSILMIGIVGFVAQRRRTA